jgi:phage-related protein
MLQSSWQNLLTEFGKENGDIETRIQEVVDSIGAVMSNALPVVERILAGMGKAIGDFAARAGEYFMEHRTEIYDKVGQFILEALKAIVSAVPYIVEGIAYLIGSLIEYVVTHIPQMLEAAGQLMLAFLQAVANAAGPAMTAMNEVGQSILDAIGNFLGSMFDAGANIIQSLINGILSGIGALGDALSGIGDFIVSHKGPPSYDRVMLKQSGQLIMGGLINGIQGEIPTLKSAIDDVNAAIGVNASMNGGASVANGGVNIYVNVEACEGDDWGEVGRRIGQATAYELRMQGVSA